jgi:hypothetical protein
MTSVTVELEGRRRAQPDGLRGFGTAIAPAVRNSGIEVNAVAGAKAVPDAADFNFDRAREDNDAVLTFVGKQRPTLRAGWRLNPEKRGPAAHVGRQQFVMNTGSRKSELFALIAAYDSNRRISVPGVLKHQLSGRNSQGIRKTAQGRDRGREQTPLDLAEVTNREVRFLGKLDKRHARLLAIGADGVAERTFGFTHWNALRIGRRLSPRFHPSSPIRSQLPSRQPATNRQGAHCNVSSCNLRP